MTSEDVSVSKTVLVIDDDILMADLIREILIEDGHRVCVANDGQAGVDMALEVKPDLILMDITMPGLDGYQATEKLKQSEAVKDVPVIFLTGKSPIEDGGRAFAYGGVSYLMKPFTNQQIRDVVRLSIGPVEALEGES